MSRKTIWTEEEDQKIKRGMLTFVEGETMESAFRRISRILPSKTPSQVRSRWYTGLKDEVNEEDNSTDVYGTSISAVAVSTFSLSASDLKELPNDALRTLALKKLGIETSKAGLIRFLMD